MRNKILIFTILALNLSACEFFNSKEEQAIQLVQKTKVQFDPENVFASVSMSFHKEQEVTWLYYAEVLSDEENCTKNNWASRYRWSSKKTEDDLFYLVSFLD